MGATVSLTYGLGEELIELLFSVVLDALNGKYLCQNLLFAAFQGNVSLELDRLGTIVVLLLMLATLQE